MYARVDKVEKLSSISLTKVVDFFITFDKKFVRKKKSFHGNNFLSLDGTQLAVPSTHVCGLARRESSNFKKPY